VRAGEKTLKKAFFSYLYGFAALVGTLCGEAQTSHALSTGCASFAAGTTYTVSGSFPSIDFEAGEILSITTTTGDTTDAIVIPPGTVVLPTANAARTVTYTFPTTRSYMFAYAVTAPATMTVSCSAPGAPAAPGAPSGTGDSGSSEISRSTILKQLAKTTGGNLPVLRDTEGLIADRIRAALPGGHFKGLNGSTPLGLASVATDRGGRGGAAGGDSDTRLAAWANFAWSAVKSHDRAYRRDRDSFTVAGGMDYFLTPDVLAGAALSLSYSHKDSPTKTVESEDIGFMIAPYVAWALNDVFSLDASLGYGTSFSDNRFLQGTATGDTLSHRYFLSTSASGRTYWDRLGFQGDVGLFWAQAFQESYRLSDNTEIEEQDSSLGTLFTRLRPSYVVYSDEEAAIEPFVSAGYEYDYARSKVSGASDDRDVFKVGGGLTLFGDGLKGQVSAETELGRENQEAMTLNGTLRVDF